MINDIIFRLTEKLVEFMQKRDNAFLGLIPGSCKEYAMVGSAYQDAISIVEDVARENGEEASGHSVLYEKGYEDGYRDGVKEYCLTNEANGWISVSDRLPEFTEILEMAPGIKCSKYCMVATETSDREIVEKIGRYYPTGYWDIEIAGGKVLAWQPLPEKYKKQGE